MIRSIPFRVGPFIRTIRVRLTFWYIVLLALILVAFSAVLYVVVSRHLYAELDRSLNAEAAEVVASRDVTSGQPTFQEVPDFRLTGVAVVVYDRSGTRIVSSDAPNPWPLQADLLARASRGESSLTSIRVRGDGPWRVLTLPAVADGQPIGLLQVARSEEDVQETLASILTFVVVAIPATLLLAVAGGVFLAGRALDPIDRITRAAEKLSAEDLSRRLNFVGVDDEVGRLATTFDRMLDRVDRAFKRQRRFTADASHDLRTPLTLMISQGDLALERPRTAAAYREVIASMREDARQMGRLVSELLVLARADAGVETLEFESIRLRDLVIGVVDAFQPLAKASDVGFSVGKLDPVVVQGDQTRLTQLLSNLVDNALKYTPKGGTVIVSVERTGSNATLVVTDTGVGIAPEHLPHLFERFYRVDRSRSESRGGAGLGLAIGKWIVESHQGRIDVVSSPGAGATFTVTLPLERTESAGSAKSAAEIPVDQVFQRAESRNGPSVRPETRDVGERPSGVDPSERTTHRRPHGFS